MKRIPFLVLVVLTACTKNDHLSQKSVNQKTSPERCNFGQTAFNFIKRTAPTTIQGKGKPVITDPIAANSAVIYLDFTGAIVRNTSWNVNGPIDCAAANLTPDQVVNILNRVAEDYRPFNVAVTNDSNIYNTADRYKRMHVIVTESWEWYGQAGGTSYIGSFTWGDNTPCFVFSSLLNYSEKKIGEACAHEVGHTLGLRHQAAYTDCLYISDYNTGQGDGVLSWAPIMGNSYYRNITTWYNGSNPYGCTSLQDDLSIISSTLGYKTDDYPNNWNNGASSVTGTVTGILNNNTDVDFFYLASQTTTTISVMPYNLGNMDGANMDLVLKVFDFHGNPLQIINDPSSLAASVALPPGKYYYSVSADANAFSPRYGMLGKYSVTVQ